VTLLPDTVRIAYTVFFGDRPGLIERRRIDANGDGLLDENEAKTFSTRLHAEIVPLIDVKIDGAPPGAPWRVADLGLGTPTTQAGAFALDLVLVAPIDPARETHTVWIEDRWKIPEPGETEVRIEESPGVHVVESHARRDGRGAVLDFKFLGHATTPGERGLFVSYRVDEAVRRTYLGKKPEGAQKTGGSSRMPIIIGVGTAVLLVIWLLLRRTTGGRRDT